MQTKTEIRLRQMIRETRKLDRNDIAVKAELARLNRALNFWMQNVGRV